MGLDHRFEAMHEIILEASKQLDKNLWNQVVGGSETETTLLRNRLGLDRLAFRPRVLRDVSSVDPSIDFFGSRIPIPVLLAPVGSLDFLRDGGGLECARAAADFGAPFFVGSIMEKGLERVAEASSGVRVYQFYARGDGAWIDEHVQRAVDHGYAAVCLTVDTAVTSRRERLIAERYERSWRKGAIGTEYQAALKWDDVERLRAKHKVTLMLKGIASSEDAERACQMGIDVVYVSNHGGRQLDCGRGAIEVLPEVVATVAGRAKVFVDGAIGRGTDVLKAVALGADAVGIGRLYVYGMLAAGYEGVQRVLELLKTEIEISMALLGITRLDELDPSYVHAAEPVRPPHAHSAFPLLEGYRIGTEPAGAGVA